MTFYRVQEKVARFIYDDFGRTSKTEPLTRPNLPSLFQRYQQYRLKCLYQMTNGHYRVDLSELYSLDMLLGKNIT